MENMTSEEEVCGFTSQFNVSFGDAFELPYVKYRFATEVIVGGIFCVFGLVGNAVSFVVLGFIPGQSTPVLLRALALADILYLIACLFFQVFKPVHYYISAVSAALPWFAYIEVVVWPLATMAQTASVWLIVLVSGDRCLGISRPLHAKSIATRTRALIAVLCVALFAIFFNLPTAFDLDMNTISDTCSNETRFEVGASDLAKDPMYQLVYKVIFCFIFRTAIPLFLVIGFNVQILRAIRRSRLSHIDALNNKSPRSLNKVVACVVCIFIVCELPDFAYRVLRVVLLMLRSDQVEWSKARYFPHFSNLMLTVNSSINFIAYYGMGKQFRQILREVSCKCRGKRQPSAPLTSRQTSLSTTKTTSLVVRMHSLVGHHNIDINALNPSSKQIGLHAMGYSSFAARRLFYQIDVLWENSSECDEGKFLMSETCTRKRSNLTRTLQLML
ncbi:hypothetical protein CAPTEDRAFT_218440 [Capitella teleta]|uniref:G-protein coupled receptors family 1 profile domain-containing protein n=1 Tax=Capitella teleta TaxID=283909 RepID=R7VM08_CAPTE|nr:hypothetical protein CAPTEDRAFT_218440 [Capitella teleta]|eukprot:ELU18716.1 hypothetical protein CAPTEDRAFT_218440 [Capitella teleta]